MSMNIFKPGKKIPSSVIAIEQECSGNNVIGSNDLISVRSSELELPHQRELDGDRATWLHQCILSMGATAAGPCELGQPRDASVSRARSNYQNKNACRPLWPDQQLLENVPLCKTNEIMPSAYCNFRCFVPADAMETFCPFVASRATGWTKHRAEPYRSESYVTTVWRPSFFDSSFFDIVD